MIGVVSMKDMEDMKNIIKKRKKDITTTPVTLGEIAMDKGGHLL